MSDTHGGYRAPAKPAPASGPGKLSQRTDGGPGQKVREMTGLPYGDAQALTQQESAAPMSLQQAPQVPAPDVSANGSAGGSNTPPPPFGRPTELPNQPITHGSPIGPGPGPSFSAPAARPSGAMTQMLQQLSASDATGVIAQLYQAAANRGV